MTKIIVGRGKTKVEITGALARDLEKDLLAILGPLGESVRAEGQAIVDQAKAEWPIDTGATVASLALAYRVDPRRATIEATVTTTEPWKKLGYTMWAEKVHARHGKWGGPRGTELVGREIGADGSEVRLYQKKRRFQPGRTAGRGGVVKDLMRLPAKAAKERLKVAIPALAAALLEREMSRG